MSEAFVLYTYKNLTDFSIQQGSNAISQQTAQRKSCCKNQQKFSQQTSKRIPLCHSKGLHNTVLRHTLSHRHLKKAVENKNAKHTKRCDDHFIG